MQPSTHSWTAAVRVISRSTPVCMACLLALGLAGCDAQVVPAKSGTTGLPPDGRPVATLGPDDAIRVAGDAAGTLDSRRASETDTAPARRGVTADQMKQSIDTTGKVALQVSFDTEKSTLRPEADPLIEQIATLLRGDPGLRLSIDGHTDASGETAHNRALSRQRAETVRAALIVKGIDADRLQAQGFGADHPVADNGSEEGRARNRRVELVRRD